MLRLLPALLCLSTLLIHAGGAHAESPHLFQLNGVKYTAQQLPETIQQQIFEARMEAYRKQEGIIDDAILQIELARIAKEKGQSVNQVATQLFAAEQPTDTEVAAFYEKNKSNIPYPLAQVRPQVSNLLIRQKIAEKQTAWLKQLKKDQWFEIGLTMPLAPVVQIDTRGAPSKGPADAGFTIVEFADYQCPHCKTASTALKKLSARFTRDLRVVFMDLPINRSGISRLVAEGAYCAQQQGKFWQYHDLAFERQAKLNKSSATDLAGAVDLDMKAFKACLASGDAEKHIARSESEAERLGINSTPTLYLNGRLQHLHDIEQELAAKFEKAAAK